MSISVSTDYYRPIANAVSRLRPNTLAARRSIYDQARHLLFEEAHSTRPPMPVSELIAEQRALEDAISAVEAEFSAPETMDAPEEDDYFRPPPRTRGSRPVQEPVRERPRSRQAPPPAQEPQDDYEYYEQQEQPYEQEAFEDYPPAAQPNPMREREQRRLEAEQRRTQRNPRGAQPRRSSRPGVPKSTVIIVAAALVALFLAGGAGAYVMIYGWPSIRSAPQAKQQPKKEETKQPEVDQSKLRDMMERASKALEGGDPATAIQLLTEAIVMSPKDPGAYTLRGHSYLQTGEAERAIEDFSEAIKLGSRDFYAFIGRAVAYRRIRDFTRSISDYNEAIKIRPDHAGAWNNRCFVQAIAGDLNAALSDCNQSLKLVPNEPNTLDSRALVYLKQSKWDLAIADYDAVLKIAPNTVSALYGRGFAKMKKGDKKGQADISTATAAAPTIAQEFERYGVK